MTNCIEATQLTQKIEVDDLDKKGQPIILLRPQKILCKSELSTSLQTKLKKEEKV